MFVRKATVSELGNVKTVLGSAREELLGLESSDDKDGSNIALTVKGLDAVLASLEKQMNPVPEPSETAPDVDEDAE